MWEAIAKNSKLYFLTALWLSVCWAYSGAFPRPFDDAKDLIFYVGAGLFTLWSIAEKKETHFRINPIFFCVGLYFLFGIASAAFAHAKYESIISLGKLWICVGFAWSLSVIDGVTLLRLIKISVWNAAVIAFLNILQINNFNIFTEFSGFIFPVGHISYYSLFMATHVPLAAMIIGQYWVRMSRYYPHEIRKAAPAWIVCFCLCLFLILIGQLISATRAGFVGLVVGLVVLIVGALALWMNWKVVVASIAIVLPSLLFIYFFQPVGLQFRGDILNRLIHLSSNERMVGYFNTLRMIQDRIIIGWGPGNFRFVYPEYGHTPGIASMWFYHPHNEILNQLSEVGVLGFSTVIGLLFFVAYYSIKKLRQLDPPLGVGLLFVICGMVVAFISFQFDTSFLLPISRMILCLYAAIFIKIMRDDIPNFNINIMPLVVIVTLISMSYVSFYQVSLFAVMKSRADESNSLKWAERASRFAPGAFEPLYQMNAVKMSQGVFNSEEVQNLYNQFPYVPSVLYLSAVDKIYKNKIRNARALTEHALMNDPGYVQADELLKTLNKLDEKTNDEKNN